MKFINLFIWCKYIIFIILVFLKIYNRIKIIYDLNWDDDFIFLTLIYFENRKDSSNELIVDGKIREIFYKATTVPIYVNDFHTGIGY